MKELKFKLKKKKSSSLIAFDVLQKVAKLHISVKVGSLGTSERCLIAKSASVELGAVLRVACVVVRGQTTFKKNKNDQTTNSVRSFKDL